MLGKTTSFDLPAVRALFPGAARWTYLDVAARGLMSTETRAAIDAHHDERMLDGGDKPAMFAALEAARAGFARILNATPDEIAITKNISEGLNIIATSVPMAAGDNVVVCAAREHPNNVYVWHHLARRRGIEVRIVDDRDGVIDPEAMIAAMDGRTRIVSVSSTSFLPGFRTDLDTIGAACRAGGAVFLVDAAQSAGILHHDMAATPVDAMAVSTQKGLMGLYGMGFLYVRAELAEGLDPVYLARFGVDLGDAHEAATGTADYALMPAARRFDLGNYNFPAAIALLPALDLIERVGTPAIEAHVIDLAGTLADGLADCGLPVWSPPTAAARSSMVTLGRDEADAARLAPFAEALAASRVKYSVRHGRLRFSFHLYNDASDVAAVLDVARRMELPR
ncbi:aminotransferase class V-fold PLP-dependent enzyme [Acuticoccus mangrovi]|uniref:Aminotransferase class V-fold PLP-dependent enzyme n=1 Tax=Acuticoccus mangrovi TaxID=2796142 RepID=A0A934IL59_9HYPH|nr:aminotransferase class V-fold PLP-dependent enzyme [Acuticoccus mangrovi]MBJ3778533.1 aminotransferase class V-fold PLP-dependent enzyme [Acuticoccus mangrovi]